MLVVLEPQISEKDGRNQLFWVITPFDPWCRIIIGLPFFAGYHKSSFE